MKQAFTAIAMAALIAFTGCDKGTSGGPGKDKAKDSTVKGLENKVIQGEDTFSLKVPSVTLKQNETKTTTITIKRGKNFGQDVALMFEGKPDGVTLEPASPKIKKGDTELVLTVKASGEAALGTFTVKVKGHPETGDDSTEELKVTVEKK